MCFLFVMRVYKTRVSATYSDDTSKKTYTVSDSDRCPVFVSAYGYLLNN